MLFVWSAQVLSPFVLHELGIDTDPERFADQAKKSGSCSALRDSWTQGKERYDLWDDFPFPAAEELWHRLTPGLLCPEIVSRYMDNVIRTSEGGDQYCPGSENRPLLQAALPLLDYLESFPANERAMRYQEVSACTIYDYQEVLLDAILTEGGISPTKQHGLRMCSARLPRIAPPVIRATCPLRWWMQEGGSKFWSAFRRT
jgi:hypothetical protein